MKVHLLLKKIEKVILPATKARRMRNFIMMFDASRIQLLNKSMNNQQMDRTIYTVFRITFLVT